MLVKFYKNIFGGCELQPDLFDDDLDISDNLLENILMQGTFNNKNIEIESNDLKPITNSNLHENTSKDSLSILTIEETDFETVTYAHEDTNQFKKHAAVEWPDINKRYHKLKYLIYHAQVEELVEIAKNKIIDKKQFNKAIFLVITTCRVTVQKCGFLDEKCFSNFEKCINNHEGQDQYLNFIYFMECTILNMMHNIYKANTYLRVYKKPKNVITNTLFYLKYPSTPYDVVKFKKLAFLFYEILLKRYENVHNTPHSSVISRIFIKISKFYKNNNFLFTTEDQTNIERVMLKDNLYKNVKSTYQIENACKSKYYERKLDYLKE